MDRRPVLVHNPPMDGRPKTGITVGDPAGIGPEILDASLDGLDVTCTAVVYGPEPIVRRLALDHPGLVPVPTSGDTAGIVEGRYTRESGAASVAALTRAVGDLAAGAVSALVTGPICKVALAEAGLPYPGQTEWVADATGTRKYAMMLAGPRLRVALASTHLALKDVAASLTGKAIEDTVELTHSFLVETMSIPGPRIAVLGLNPHASDEGRFGVEEARLIEPAVRRLRDSGISAVGPLPADTAFHRAVTGEFDAVVAMYHDQGLGPLKLIHFNDAINVTLGLPAVRCSPDHGPAFDIAGMGRADPSSMSAALNFAARAAARTMS